MGIRYVSLIILFILLQFVIGCSNEMADNVEGKTYNHVYNEPFSDSSFLNWHANSPDNWELMSENNENILYLIRNGTFGKIRKPSSYAILSHLDVTNFELMVEAKCLIDTAIAGRDINIFFGFQDSVHFYYAHISNRSNTLHNIIGLVDGKDRVPITHADGDNSKARLRDYKWHKIKIIRNIDSGSIKVFVDDMRQPVLSVIDKTLINGKVGLGSFDDYGQFKNFQLKYNLHKK